MTKTLTPETEKALSFPVGVVSPLWLMFAGAAAAGAAVFWARQWLKPTNLEALTPLPVEEPVDEVAETTVEATVEVAEPILAASAEVAETALEAAPEAVEAAADDLTKLTGIGPKLAASLAERGVTRFADIAAWTEADVETFDKDMKLMGRIGREAWIAQARRFAETATH